MSNNNRAVYDELLKPKGTWFAQTMAEIKNRLGLEAETSIDPDGITHRVVICGRMHEDTEERAAVLREMGAMRQRTFWVLNKKCAGVHNIHVGPVEDSTGELQVHVTYKERATCCTEPLPVVRDFDAPAVEKKVLNHMMPHGPGEDERQAREQLLVEFVEAVEEKGGKVGLMLNSERGVTIQCVWLVPDDQKEEQRFWIERKGDELHEMLKAKSRVMFLLSMPSEKENALTVTFTWDWQQPVIEAIKDVKCLPIYKVGAMDESAIPELPVIRDGPPIMPLVCRPPSKKPKLKGRQTR